MADFTDYMSCDEYVTNLALKLRPIFEEKVQRTFNNYQPQTFSSRKDTEDETTYCIKLDLGDEIYGEVKFRYNSSNNNVQIVGTEISGNLGNMDLV
jgi:hypothetical protein